jgi:hypothetical protein
MMRYVYSFCLLLYSKFLDVAVQNKSMMGWTQPPLFSRLDDANVTWRVYHDEIAFTWLLTYMRTPQAVSRHRWMAQFAADALAGDLPQVSPFADAPRLLHPQPSSLYRSLRTSSRCTLTTSTATRLISIQPTP